MLAENIPRKTKEHPGIDSPFYFISLYNNLYYFSPHERPALFLGHELCAMVTRMLSSDLYRIPLVVSRTTYSLAAAVVVVSACLSGIIVKNRLDRLNLVAVLKARE